MSADRNLLFGVLALQADLLDAAGFAEACSAWAARKDIPLASLLVERGWLTPEDRDAVEQFLQRKLKKHAGDVRASLAEVLSDPVRQTLAGIADPAVRHTLSGVACPDGVHEKATLDYQPVGRARYTLTRLHARGGIGQVWLARDGDLGREVALKELLAGSRDHSAAVARFLEEAQITGQLEHPNIVPLYELARPAGDGAVPFYTMRFVRGRTLAVAIQGYHRKRRAKEAGPLELRELLGHWLAVCNAVAYAHSRGVLHRDLKPQNVVLGDFGEVIVLDWGLAKVKGAEERQASLLPVSVGKESSREGTLQGQILGTPSYMPPEQAEGRLDLVDERSDIYGLGTVLYEMLVGEPPFDSPDTLSVLVQVVAEPPLPPRRKVPQTPRALEAICLKALAKRPADRYASAKDLAQDVQNWLADEPVSAYQEPLGLRASRWARRHKPLVAGSAALLMTAVVALTVGTVLLTQANARTREQGELARENAAAALQAEARAREEEQKARRAAAKAEAINKFLVSDMLLAAAPTRALGRKTTVLEVLEAAAKRIDQAFADQPETEVAVRSAIYEAFMRLGLYPEAEAQLRHSLEVCRRAMGPDHPLRFEVVGNLAYLAQLQGKYAESVEWGGEAVAGATRVLGPENPDTLVTRNNLAGSLFFLGKPDEAEALMRENRELCRRTLGPDHEHTLTAVNDLAFLLKDRGKWAEAEPLFRESAEGFGKKLGAEHPHTLTALENIGTVLRNMGELKEAERLYRKSLEARRRIQGPGHHATLIAMVSLGIVLEGQGKRDEAEALLRDALPKLRKALPAGHPNIAVCRRQLGRLLTRKGQAREAEPLLREALESDRKGNPKRGEAVAQSELALGLCLAELGRHAEAEPLLLVGYKTLAANPDGQASSLREARDGLVRFYEAWGKPTEAAKWKAKSEQQAKPATPKAP